MLVALLSLISSNDVEGVRIDSKIFSGLSLSLGLVIGLLLFESTIRPRNTDPTEPPLCCCGVAPLEGASDGCDGPPEIPAEDVDDEDCCLVDVVETRGDFGK